MVAQGDIWWADLVEPLGSGPGSPRPVVIVQGDTFNRSGIATVVVVPFTSNPKWARSPGNVLLRPSETGLPRDSVANVSQIIAVDRRVLTEFLGRLTRSRLDLILAGIDVVLGR